MFVSFGSVCLNYGKLYERLNCGVQVGVDLHMPMLLVRYHRSRASPGFDQGSHFCHEVVHY